MDVFSMAVGILQCDPKRLPKIQSSNEKVNMSAKFTIQYSQRSVPKKTHSTGILQCLQQGNSSSNEQSRPWLPLEHTEQWSEPVLTVGYFSLSRTMSDAPEDHVLQELLWMGFPPAICRSQYPFLRKYLLLFQEQSLLEDGT